MRKKWIYNLLIISLPCRSAYDFFNFPMLVVILTLKCTSPKQKLHLLNNLLINFITIILSNNSKFDIFLCFIFCCHFIRKKFTRIIIIIIIFLFFEQWLIHILSLFNVLSPLINHSNKKLKIEFFLLNLKGYFLLINSYFIRNFYYRCRLKISSNFIFFSKKIFQIKSLYFGKNFLFNKFSYLSKLDTYLEVSNKENTIQLIWWLYIKNTIHDNFSFLFSFGNKKSAYNEFFSILN